MESIEHMVATMFATHAKPLLAKIQSLEEQLASSTARNLQPAFAEAAKGGSSHRTVADRIEEVDYTGAAAAAMMGASGQKLHDEDSVPMATAADASASATSTGTASTFSLWAPPRGGGAPNARRRRRAARRRRRPR